MSDVTDCHVELEPDLDYFSRLPDEIIAELYSFMKISDCVRLSMTCSRLHKVLCSTRAAWKSAFKADNLVASPLLTYLADVERLDDDSICPDRTHYLIHKRAQASMEAGEYNLRAVYAASSPAGPTGLHSCHEDFLAVVTHLTGYGAEVSYLDRITNLESKFSVAFSKALVPVSISFMMSDQLKVLFISKEERNEEIFCYSLLKDGISAQELWTLKTHNVQDSNPRIVGEYLFQMSSDRITETMIGNFVELSTGKLTCLPIAFPEKCGRAPTGLRYDIDSAIILLFKAICQLNSRHCEICFVAISLPSLTSVEFEDSGDLIFETFDFTHNRILIPTFQNTLRVLDSTTGQLLGVVDLLDRPGVTKSMVFSLNDQTQFTLCKFKPDTVGHAMSSSAKFAVNTWKIKDERITLSLNRAFNFRYHPRLATTRNVIAFEHVLNHFVAVCFEPMANNIRQIFMAIFTQTQDGFNDKIVIKDLIRCRTIPLAVIWPTQLILVTAKKVLVYELDLKRD